MYSSIKSAKTLELFAFFSMLFLDVSVRSCVGLFNLDGIVCLYIYSVCWKVRLLRGQTHLC